MKLRLFPGSLLWRTLLVVVLALALSQGAAMWLLNEYVTRPRMETAIGQFVFHLKTILAALETMGPGQQRQFITRVAEHEGIRIAPVRGSESLRPAPDIPQLRIFRERLREHFGAGTEVYVRGREAGSDEPPAMEAPPRADSDGRPRVLWVRLPTREREFWVAIPRTRVERETATAFLSWGAAGLGIAILSTFLLMWHLTRPLQELARAALAIGRGRDPPPVSESGPTEIRQVARAFNQMKEDLQRNERERATFLAGISHDLRTPLTRLRLDVEMLERKVDPAVQRGMVADLDDMNAIIDQFLDFTRSESAEPLSPVDLAELARSSAERAARSGAQVRCEIDPVPMLPLRPLAMQRLIDNLLGNAAKHAGGEIVLRTRQAVGHHVELAVLDRGPGIPPEMVERLKQPFTRLDESRSGASGAGLGLAIANRIATLHGATLDLLPREGGGLEARLGFPVPKP
ncbi:MAG TPA: ATP-binding protein [Usitatibacter sp.]|nr:ATP-binding protein [Usitatibacter sp.]